MPRHGSLGPPQAPERPDPPEGMEASAASMWQFTVEAMPAGWLRMEYYELLAMYCHHASEWRRCRGQVEAVWRQAADGQGVDQDQLDFWQGLCDREARRFSDLATKLRLTPQAVMDRTKKPQGGAAKRPWEQ